MAMVLTGLLISQSLFAKAYGESDFEVIYCMTRTIEGGFAAAGQDNGDFIVLKLADNGSLSWARTFGGLDPDLAWSIIQTPDNGFAVAGMTSSPPAVFEDFLVLKLDSDGNLSWARIFGGTSDEYLPSIAPTLDGGLVVAGTTYSFGGGNTDCLILKLKPDGSLSWARTFGGTDEDWAMSIIQTTDSGFAVAGQAGNIITGEYDFLIFRMDNAGNLIWARTFGGAISDRASSIIQTTDSGFVIAGETTSFGAGNSDFLVLKLDPDGSLSWARTFGGVGDDGARSIIHTSDGGFAVAGYTRSFGAGSTDFLILKLDPDGNLSWARTFGGVDGDPVCSITQTADSGLGIAGYTYNFGAGGTDFILLKLGPDGNYPGCVDTCMPTVMTPSLGTFSLTGLASCAPAETSVTLAIAAPSLMVTDVCPPAVEERNFISGPGLILTPASHGFHITGYSGEVEIYDPAGRLVLGKEIKGKTLIGPLRPGVYFVVAGKKRAKIAVK